MRAYKLRRFQNGKNRDGEPFYNWALTVPTEIAERLPKDIKYVCVPTDEGLLFKPMSKEPEKPSLPAWAKQENGTKRPHTRTRPGAPKVEA